MSRPRKSARTAATTSAGGSPAGPAGTVAAACSAAMNAFRSASSASASSPAVNSSSNWSTTRTRRGGAAAAAPAGPPGPGSAPRPAAVRAACSTSIGASSGAADSDRYTDTGSAPAISARCIASSRSGLAVRPDHPPRPPLRPRPQRTGRQPRHATPPAAAKTCPTPTPRPPAGSPARPAAPQAAAPAGPPARRVRRKPARPAPRTAPAPDTGRPATPGPASRRTSGRRGLRRRAASTSAAGTRPRAAATNNARAGSARPSAPASSSAVSLRAVRLMPRSRSLTDRGHRLAASASSSWVSLASARSCRSSPPNPSAGCSAMVWHPLRGSSSRRAKLARAEAHTNVNQARSPPPSLLSGQPRMLWADHVAVLWACTCGRSAGAASTVGTRTRLRAAGPGADRQKGALAMFDQSHPTPPTPAADDQDPSRPARACSRSAGPRSPPCSSARSAAPVRPRRRIAASLPARTRWPRRTLPWATTRRSAPNSPGRAGRTCAAPGPPMSTWPCSYLARQYTDGYETVSFYQQLTACAKHRRAPTASAPPDRAKNTMSHIRWAFVLTAAAAMAVIVTVAASVPAGRKAELTIAAAADGIQFSEDTRERNVRYSCRTVRGSAPSGLGECPQGASLVLRESGQARWRRAGAGSGGWAGGLDKWCASSRGRRGERARWFRAAQPGWRGFVRLGGPVA